MTNKRIWEIDYLRTLAIVLMVIFHIIYDLNEFAGIRINYWSGWWYWEGKISALLFIFLAGISSGFSKRNIKRGLVILLVALIISIVTYIYFEERYIRFGILHLLGTSMILFPLLNKISKGLLYLLSIGILSSVFWINDLSFETALLIPLGFEYTGFSSVDYYPILPYLGIFILGIIAYKSYYHKRKSLFIFDYENKLIVDISKNSLLIYIFHQPIIIAIIYLIKFLTNGEITT